MDINSEVDPFESSSDFLSGAAPSVTMHTSPMLKTEFSPWHKPRKQWIREKQWGVLTRALIESLKLKENNRPLTYLSLPGVDLLDVRSLEDVCSSSGVKVKFLGLNYIEEEKQELLAEQALSLNEVRALPYVHQDSTLLTERFEDLCDETSIVSQQVLAKQKTYDVINIDLCASFAKHKPGTWDSLYTAVHKLLIHQVYYRTEPWLFLITTRTDKEKVDPDAFQKLINSVLESVSPEISHEYLEERIGIDPAYIEANKLTQDKVSELQHKYCFTASFGIWKLRLLLTGDYKTKSHMHPLYAYHVESKDAVPDMASMSFWCSRLPPSGIDPSGLSFAAVNATQPAVVEVFKACSRRAFESSLNGKDLDMQLAENPEEFKLFLERSKKLLRRARYSVDKYEEWVYDQQEKINVMISRG